ncbi:hypothetical protein D3C73_1101520 [compost metagenome]
MILALGNVQDVFEQDALGCQHATGVGEELRVRLLETYVIDGDPHVERLVEGLGHVVQGPDLRVGGGHQLEVLAQALEGFDRIRERREVLHRLRQALGIVVVVRQAELGGDDVVAAFQVVRPPARIGRGACLAIGLENLVVAAGLACFTRNFADMGENTGFEIDQGTDNVKRQGFELLERHRALRKKSRVGETDWTGPLSARLLAQYSVLPCPRGITYCFFTERAAPVLNGSFAGSPPTPDEGKARRFCACPRAFPR